MADLEGETSSAKAVTDLYPYQRRYVDGIIKAVNDGAKKILIILSTGGGKTTLAGHAISTVLNKGLRCMFVAHRTELIEQSAKRLTDQFGIQCGILAAGYKTTDHSMQVASIQTLSRREFPDVDVVFIDECHRIKAATYQKMVDHYEGKFIVGLTATPFRGDGQSVIDEFDIYLHEITFEQLIKKGYLVRPEIHIVKNIDFSKVKIKRGEYDIEEIGKILSEVDIAKNVVKNYREKINGKTFIFCSSVKQSKFYTAYFNNSGIKCIHVDGNTPKKERKRAVELFENGEVDCFCNVGIAVEGVDVRNAIGVILLKKTKSPGNYLQMIGRGTRSFKGKGKCIVLDYGNNAIEHGLPEEYDTVDWKLYEREKGKRTKSEEKGKVCPMCNKVNSRSIELCECGYKFPEKASEFKIKNGEVDVTLSILKSDRDQVYMLSEISKKEVEKVPVEYLRVWCVLHGYKPSYALYEAFNRKRISIRPNPKKPSSYALANKQLLDIEVGHDTYSLYTRVKNRNI